MQLKDRVDVELLANIVQSIPSVIFFKDTELRYLFSTHYWEQLDLGEDDEAADIYGKTDRDIRKDTENLDKQEASDRQILETGIGSSYTIKSVVDGHTQYLDLIKEPVKDKDGKVIGVVGLINDVTHVTIELEKALKEAERVAEMKSDFLANMSHEIRTPMNAVIGMAELALREDLPPAAREYIAQIKSSGSALLNIINDILDFSKIDAGKFEIIEDEYEPLSTIHDMSSVLVTRIGDKDLDLIGEVNPNMPAKLYGDDMRIRQIVLNLANNAIKFTSNGYVLINIDYEKTSEDTIDLIAEVKDTGIGIKEEDIGKLFNAFQQVDNRRTRNVEGTGLGLAICASLLELMNGSIDVKSVYGEGSSFTVRIPQKVISWEPAIEVQNAEKKAAIGYWKSSSDAFFYEVLNHMNVEAYRLNDFSELDTLLASKEATLKDKEIVLFTSYSIYNKELRDVVKNYPNIKFSVTCDYSAKTEDSEANVRFLRKPYSTLAIAAALNNEAIHVPVEEAFEFDYIAPDARILIVDDNEVNLAVAEGILEPLRMHIDTATSGKQAIRMIDSEKYDIVFMDHMMPELDGVETTKLIRKNHPELSDMPIIALSANAVAEAKKMFHEEGLDDFVAKPIEVRTITSKIKQWLPEELIVREFDAQTLSEPLSEKSNVSLQDRLHEESNGQIVPDVLDVTAAVKMIGNEKLYMTILEKYFSAIKAKAEIISASEKSEDIATYTIEVHALKSASKQIGAVKLSEMAAELEACGHAGDIETIHEKTDRLVADYLTYVNYLEPLFKKEEDLSDKPKAEANELNHFFGVLLEAADNLDMDIIEETVEKMNQYAYSDNGNAYFEEIKEAAGNYDMDSVTEIIEKWKADL